MTLDFQQAAVSWLAAQDKKTLRIAREIVTRRKSLATLGRGTAWQRTERAHEVGFIYGLTLALSYLSDRPGDISQTGAEGFIGTVEQADLTAAEVGAGMVSTATATKRNTET